MTKVQSLPKRKADWLRQERRDFIDAYTEEWEKDGWKAEWDEHEQELRLRWREQNPDGTEDDWDEWGKLELIIWQARRREALREEAQDQWKQRELEYEKRWEENYHNPAG